MPDRSRQQLILLLIVCVLVLFSTLLFLWYRGWFSSSAEVTRVPALQNTQVKSPDLFQDPRFQQLRLDTSKPIDVGPVGNPSPFMPLGFQKQEP